MTYAKRGGGFEDLARAITGLSRDGPTLPQLEEPASDLAITNLSPSTSDAKILALSKVDAGQVLLPQRASTELNEPRGLCPLVNPFRFSRYKLQTY